MNCECGPNTQAIKRAFIRQATREGAAMVPPLTAKEVIELWLDTLMKGPVKTALLNGRMVISTSEANGSVTFAIPEGMAMTSAVAMLEIILEEMEGTMFQIKRLRQCYNIASL